MMPHSGRVRVDGAEWLYHCAGEGEIPLLVLPGALGGSGGIAQLTSGMLPAARVLVPEYAPVASLDACLEAIDRILEAERIGRIAVFGGSFGGMIAQCWARRHPDRVSALILSGTVAPDSRRVRKHRKSLWNLPFLPLGFLRFVMRLVLRGMVRQAGEERERWLHEYRMLIARMRKEDFASRYRVAMDYDANCEFKPENLRSVHILILEGERDRVAGRRQREQLRSLYPAAHTHVFQGAGHSMMLTHSEEWSNTIQDFLKNSK